MTLRTLVFLACLAGSDRLLAQATSRTEGATNSSHSRAPSGTIVPVEVVDIATGDRLSGVEICELLSGACVSTTPDTCLADLASLAAHSALYPTALFAFRKPGFRADTLRLDLSRDTSARTIALVPRPLGSIGSDSAIMLPGVLTTSSNARARVADFNLAGFFARRELFGQQGSSFITPGELRDRWDAYGDIRVPLAGHGFCGYTYVDGHLQIGLPLTSVQSYAAIEYYPDTTDVPPEVHWHLDDNAIVNPGGGMPRRYGRCAGVILLWTQVHMP